MYLSFIHHLKRLIKIIFMKKSIIYLSIAAASITSCSKSFVDIAPDNFISANNYFREEADFVQGTNATYAPLRNVYNIAYVNGEMRSDNTHYIFNNSNRGNLVREEIADFIDNPTAEPTYQKWQFNYRVIAYANEVLSRIDNFNFSSAAVKDGLKGELLFLRSFAYFDLLQYFGDVPLVLTPTSGPAAEIIGEKSTMLRTPKAEVYTQIIADIKESINLLPVKSAQVKGRATKGSAQMLLGNIYVVRKDWPAAHDAVKSIIDGNQYRLVTEYANIYSTGNKNNEESIFEIQYLQGNIGLQSTFAYTFMPNLTNLSPITGFTFNNQSIGGWNIPSEDLITSYETGDKRKAASIVNGYTGSNGSFVNQPFIKKYHQLPIPAPNGSAANGNDNFPVYRYAEALLYMAEILNEQGKSAEALPYLNEIRKRAGLGDITNTNQVQLRSIILHERRVELAFENKRWLDLVRTGNAVAVMNAYGAALKASGNHPNLVPSTYNVNENKLLFPIPFNERLVNPKLEQNPGY